MLVVLSPAKKLDMDEGRHAAVSEPQFGADAKELAGVARGLSEEALQKLMGISPALAKLNAERFSAFGAQGRKAAALAFAGDTYQGLEAASLEPEEMGWAQDHLRILSGLYGLLRPLDAIEPYRLEMGSRLKTSHGTSLYDYWGTTLSEALTAQGRAVGAEVLVNCASQEYFGAVDREALGLRVVTPVFMEERAGGPKIISFFAKQARGAMARYIITHRLTDPQSLQAFDTGGYAYRPDMSEPDRPVFVRGEQG